MNKRRNFVLFFLLLFLSFSPPVLAGVTLNSLSPDKITSLDDILTLNASVSATNTTQYLQVGITKDGATDYFGLTQTNNLSWVAYRTSSNSLGITGLFSVLPVNGVWSGEVKAKLDGASANFKGNGSYSLKLYKYVSSLGSSLSSNSLNFTVEIPQTTPTPTPSPTPSPTPTPTPTPTPSISQKNIAWSKPSSSLKIGDEFSINVSITGFESGTQYYFKIRAGQDSTSLSQGQTKNGTTLLNDNSAWTSFPSCQTDSSGSCKIDLIGKLAEQNLEGKYFMTVRVRNASSQLNDDSSSQELNFLSQPSVSPTPIPSASLSQPKSSPSVLGASIATRSAQMIDRQIDLSTHSGQKYTDDSLQNSSSSAVLGMNDKTNPLVVFMTLFGIVFSFVGLGILVKFKFLS